MKKYWIRFTGRIATSIGITYPIQEIVEANDPDAALLKLYETYDHISNPDIEEIENESN